MAAIKDNEELIKKEELLKEKQADLQSFERRLKTREKALNEYQEKLNKLREVIDTEKEREISDSIKELADINNQISERNIKLNKLNSEIDEAIATKTEKINIASNKRLSELEEQYQKEINSMMEITKKGYEDRNNLLIESVKWHDTELNKSFDKLLKQYESMLSSKTSIVDEQIAFLKKTSEELDKRMEEFANLESEKDKLDLDKKKYDIKLKHLEETINKEVEIKYNDIVTERDSYKTELDKSIQKNTELSVKYHEANDLLMTNQNLDITQLTSEINTLRESNQELIKRYGKFNDTDYQDMKNKASKYDNLQKQVETLNEKKLQLEEQIDLLKNDRINCDSLKHQKEILEQQLVINKQYFKNLKEEYDEVMNQLGETKDCVVASKSIEKELDQFKDLPQYSGEPLNEVNWLENIYTKCTNAGYKFSKRLFYSFHTCLKTGDMSPLTVLAGVSGTGKSKLPQLYCKYGGLYFLPLAVQPDWDSPQSLFGYFNSIEKTFNASDLLRALVCFQKDKSVSPTKDNIYDLSDNVLVVLLDEMNLAHVELYFSDLLSKLELKRDGSQNVSFEVDLGAKNDKYRVRLTDNVKWVGTMNEDETTKSLSDKVIDRGNVISFPRPDTFARYKKDSGDKPADKISKECWNAWVNNKYTLKEDEANKYMKIVSDINSNLIKVNRALGHRVWQSIEDYMISHPKVTSNMDVNENEGSKEKLEEALDLAFEEALVQKVMTKLRGIECDGDQRDVLNNIRTVLENAGFTSLTQDFDNAMQSVTGTFVWNSANYLSEGYND